MGIDYSERSLIQSVLSSDQSAFKVLIRRYEGLVIHIVVPLIKNETDREDICQDVFCKVYEKLHTFRFQSKLSTWIGNIAYNTAINFLKKKKNVSLDDLLSFGDGDDNGYSLAQTLKDGSFLPDELMMQKEQVKLFDDVVNQLPPIQKTILLLFHQDELSLQEVGVIVEMPVNTVKSHLFRARIKLKESLYPYHQQT